MNIDQARINAIKQQVRPWGGLNYLANDALQKTPRELFVPEKYQDLVFADIEIPLEVQTKAGTKQVASMFSPKIEGRILDALNIKPDETALEIGSGSGYLTAVIAKLCRHITSVEINKDLHQLAQEKINQLGIKNVDLVIGDASSGWQTPSFFDAVLVGASVPKIIGRYFHVMKVGGRVFVVEGLGSVMTAKLITRTSEDNWQTKSLFETRLDTMLGLKNVKPFSF